MQSNDKLLASMKSKTGSFTHQLSNSKVKINIFKQSLVRLNFLQDSSNYRLIYLYIHQERFKNLTLSFGENKISHTRQGNATTINTFAKLQSSTLSPAMKVYSRPDPLRFRERLGWIGLSLSPRTKLFLSTMLIMFVLLLVWSILPFQVNLGYLFRAFGLIAVVIAIALWSLVRRIRNE